MTGLHVFHRTNSDGQRALTADRKGQNLPTLNDGGEWLYQDTIPVSPTPTSHVGFDNLVALESIRNNGFHLYRVQVTSTITDGLTPSELDALLRQRRRPN